MADTAVALASANVQVVSRKVIGRLDSVRHGVVLPLIIGELKQSRRQRQKRLALWAKQQLYTWIALFSRCLWRPLQDYDVKPPNATFRRGREHTMTNYPFSFWRWIKSIRIQLQEKSRTFDVLRGTNRRDWQFFSRRFHYRRRCVSSPICIRTEAHNPTWKIFPLTFPGRIFHFHVPPSMWQQVILQTCFITLRIPMCHTLTCVYDFSSFLSFFLLSSSARPSFLQQCAWSCTSCGTTLLFSQDIFSCFHSMTALMVRHCNQFFI